MQKYILHYTWIRPLGDLLLGVILLIQFLTLLDDVIRKKSSHPVFWDWSRKALFHLIVKDEQGHRNKEGGGHKGTCPHNNLNN